MASLAGLLKEKGHAVAGSDKEEIYEPMRGTLARSRIKVFQPYSAENIKKWKPDIVVVGNAIPRGNPELEYALDANIPYRSVVDVLREEFIEGRQSIVVAGTHGKTTTSAMLAWLLTVAKKDPSVFVGGSTKNFESGYRYGKGKYIVLEGDEYDTSFFDKNPKFLGYRPFVGIVNNIELDHVDIYRDLEHVKSAFWNFIKLIPSEGVLIINREDENAWELIDTPEKKQAVWRGAAPHILSFGIKKGDITAKNIRIKNGKMLFDAYSRKKKLGSLTTSLAGKHNILNNLAVIAASVFLKIPFSTTKKAIASFEGVKRRMEVLGEERGITVIDDYAHHPTAVAATLKAVRGKFPKKRVVLFFEPGSASSRRRVFEKMYTAAFRNADKMFLYKPYLANLLGADELFHGEKVAMAVSRAGTPAEYVGDIDSLLAKASSFGKPNDVFIIMSCRGFDGLREKIFKSLKK